MSVNTLPKFNRGGLSGTTFGQRSSAKTTSGTSKQKAPNSISVSAKHYSLKNKKNSKYTAGTEISRGRTADYTALRRQNSTRGARFSSGVDSSFMTNAAIRMGMIQGAYGMQQGGMTTGMAILNGVGMVAQGLFGGVQQSRSVALDASMNSLGGGKFGIADINDPGLSTAALAMTSATDSQGLSSAISGAEAKLTEFQAKGPALKSAAQDATKNLSSLEGGVKSAEGAKGKATDAVGKAKQGVQGAEAGRTKAQGKLSAATKFKTEAQSKYASAKGAQATAKAADNQAQANVTSCTQAHDAAQTALTNAKTTLANTPKEIDGPNGQKIPNPAYAQAENAVKMAEAKEEATKKALEQAETKKGETAKALEKANTDLTDAEKNVSVAEKQEVDNNEALNEAIKDCEAAETKVGEAEQGVRDAEVQVAEMTEQLNVAQDACDKAKKAIADYKDYEQNASGLENTIKEQKDRLKKMLKSEKKQGSTPANNNKGTQGASGNGTVMTAEQFKNKLTTGDGTGITGFKDIGTAVCGQGPDGKMAYYMKDGSPLDQSTFEQMEQTANKLGGRINVPQDPFANPMA